jgi:hypothetical protein
MTGCAPARALTCVLLLFTSLYGASAADYRQRVGIYVWGKVAGGLAAAAVDVKKLGADHAVRVYIGPDAEWDPGGKKDNVPLDVKVRRADYRTFLAGFPVVMLTAYDSASRERYKWGRMDPQHLAATKAEFQRFALELAKTPGRKIISNWEFENDCPAKQWAACREYYQARLDGIIEGRKQARKLGHPGEILTAFEFTIVPDFKTRPSGLVKVGAELKGVDFLSYSSWWSMGADYDAATMYKSFAYGVDVIRKFAAGNKLTTRLIIGEFGEYWNLHPTAERLKAVADAGIDNGVEYLFNWLLYDQPGAKDEHGRDASHFGKYTLNRVLTPQGKALRLWFTPVQRQKSAAAGQ